MENGNKAQLFAIKSISLAREQKWKLARRYAYCSSILYKKADDILWSDRLKSFYKTLGGMINEI